jgi:hypothetical protein
MADASSESRLQKTGDFPSSVYLESLVIFFGANFLFHQNVFRKQGSRPQFALFMLVNAFTSYQIADAANLASLNRYAIIYNNTREIEHRAALNQKLRAKLYQAPQ